MPSSATRAAGDLGRAGQAAANRQEAEDKAEQRKRESAERNERAAERRRKREQQRDLLANADKLAEDDKFDEALAMCVKAESAYPAEKYRVDSRRKEIERRKQEHLARLDREKREQERLQAVRAKKKQRRTESLASLQKADAALAVFKKTYESDDPADMKKAVIAGREAAKHYDLALRSGGLTQQESYGLSSRASQLRYSAKEIEQKVAQEEERRRRLAQQRTELAAQIRRFPAKYETQISVSNYKGFYNDLRRLEAAAKLTGDPGLVAEVQAIGKELAARIYAVASKASVAAEAAKQHLEAYAHQTWAENMLPSGAKRADEGKRTAKLRVAAADAEFEIAKGLARSKPGLAREHLATTLKLTPDNKAAQKLDNDLKETLWEIAPSYINSFHLQHAGLGYTGYVEFKNAKMKSIAGEGRLTLVIAVHAEGVQLGMVEGWIAGKFSFPVTRNGFKEITTGVGGFAKKRYAFILPRIPYSSLSFEGGTWADVSTRKRVREAARRKGRDLRAFLIFEPHGLSEVRHDEKILLPQ